MLQNPCKTLGFKKNMVYKSPPGGGGLTISCQWPLRKKIKKSKYDDSRLIINSFKNI